MLISLLSIIVMLLGFTLLIFVHELGHFLAAKWAGIRAEAFAIGMGPTVVSYRSGVGVRVGSTDRAVRERFGRTAIEMSDNELAQHRIGETEYSLRALPIGGFVKMLGQDDADPGAVSTGARSYQRCSIGRRMVVISAGVIMNIILAVILFMIVFMVGVRLDAPVVGFVEDASPAAVTWPVNAESIGVSEPGLQPGDRVLHAGNRAARTFADVQIAAALSRNDVPVRLVVERDGVDQPLEFRIPARRDPVSRMMTIGVDAGRSTEIVGGRSAAVVDELLARTPTGQAGIVAGAVIERVGDRDVRVHEDIRRAFAASGGVPLEIIFRTSEGEERRTLLAGEPQLDTFIQTAPDGSANWDPGLVGLSPLLRIGVTESGPNRRLVQAGDEIVSAGGEAYPRFTQLRALCIRNAGGTLDVVVRRDGREVPLRLKVSRAGLLGIPIERASDDARVASIIRQASRPAPNGSGAFEAHETPAALIDLAPGSRIISIADEPVSDWTDIARAVHHALQNAIARDDFPARIAVVAQPPAEEAERESHELFVERSDAERLLALGWAVPTGLSSALFEPQMRVVSAGGNPLRAVAMGLSETHVFVVNTYLTIDRLLRRTVAVDQLRGPIGIIDLGARVLPRGFMYFLLLLAMISVNLAVLNFLPMPIVDGGHFLYLVYEKITGRPPSIAFQNAAMLVGLALIGTIFVVTFYNDLARLFG